ncbi:DUF1542 domain-containing protein [Nocardia thailandica]
MLWILILVLVVCVGALLYLRWAQNKRTAQELADAQAAARQVIERLGGQVYSLSATGPASRQALADASERYNAAGGQIDRAATPTQANLAEQTALEGLYYIRAARTAMNMEPGPDIPPLSGQDIAGKVEATRAVDFNGRRLTASPAPSSVTPNYYPGGRVAGRPVPAGWYSEPWWRPALVAGAWGVGAALLFTSLFQGMPGVGYDAAGFESGAGEAYTDPGPLDTPGLDPGTGLDQGYETGTEGDWSADPGGFDGF